MMVSSPRIRIWMINDAALGILPLRSIRVKFAAVRLGIRSCPMTSPTQIGLRRGFCSLALLACVTMFTPQPTAARGGSEDACARWTQKNLVIGNDLQSRRFVLEPKGGLEEMPFFRVAEGRAVYHKPFSLSLDLADGRVGIFVSNDPRTCLLARDQSSQTLRIPVFFVGRPRESLEELRDNAESLVFDPSATLDAGSDFSASRLSFEAGRFPLRRDPPIFYVRPGGPAGVRRVLPRRLGHFGCFIGQLDCQRRAGNTAAFRTRGSECASRDGVPPSAPAGPASRAAGFQAPAARAVHESALKSARRTGTGAVTSSTGAFFRKCSSASESGKLPRLSPASAESGSASETGSRAFACSSSTAARNCAPAVEGSCAFPSSSAVQA